MEIKGGCLCGAVRYTAEADPTSATVCHCRDCQKFTGSAFAALVRVPKEALTIEGTLKTFSSLGGSGNPILRHFCPRMRLVDRRGARNATRYHYPKCRNV
jgi:hypothetical protein